MTNENVNPNIPESGVRLTWNPDNKIGRGKLCELHYHDEIEILLVKSGIMSLTVDGKEHIARTGEILFVGSRVPHFTSSLSDDMNYMMIQVRTDFGGQNEALAVISSVKTENGVDAASIGDSGMAEAVEEIADEYSKKEPGFEILIKSASLKIIGRLIRLNMIDDPRRGPDRAAIRKIMPALSYINENYPQPMTLEDVCRYMGLNCAYFCRLFRTSTGITFTEYLNALRVRKSAEMLSGSSKSVTEISMDVGFSTVAYYNRVFKKYMKCTPTVYRFLKYKNM